MLSWLFKIFLFLEYTYTAQHVPAQLTPPHTQFGSQYISLHCLPPSCICRVTQDIKETRERLGKMGRRWVYYMPDILAIIRKIKWYCGKILNFLSAKCYWVQLTCFDCCTMCPVLSLGRCWSTWPTGYSRHCGSAGELFLYTCFVYFVVFLQHLWVIIK